MKKTNQGSVLIVALLMIAFVEVIMLGLMKGHKIEIKYINTMVSNAQNYQLLLGGQAWAKGIAKQIAHQETNQAIYYLPQTKILGRNVKSELVDLQGLININAIEERKIASFEYVLSVLGINASNLKELGFLNKLSGSLNNTISKTEKHIKAFQKRFKIQNYDSVNSLDAGSLFRQKFQILSETRNNKQPEHIVSISEVLELGFPTSAFIKLMPYITALPESVPLNINTASAVSMLMLDPKLTIEDTQSLIAERDQKGGFASVDEFTKLEQLTDLNIDAENVTVLSQYYLSISTVYDKEIELKLYTLLKSDNTTEKGKINVSVIWQSLGTV